MKELKAFLKNLIYVPTVTGYEKRSADRIMELCLDFAGGFFTDSYVSKTGSVILLRRCGKEGAKRLCLDAHIDTVGFAVSEVCADGYVKVACLGGIDINILPSSEAVILADTDIPAIFSSIPPHLLHSDKLPDISQMFLDTGLCDDNLKQRVKVGMPVTLKPHFTELLGDRISTIHLDDKACVAIIMQAIRCVDVEALDNTDIYVCLSSGEERGGNGALHIHEEIAPDALVVLDVNFAKESGSKDGEYGILGQGAMVSYSSVTNRGFTEFVIGCKGKEQLQIINEMTYTGTNADTSARLGLGVPSCVFSLPIRYMHSGVELCDMKDVVSASKVVTNLIEKFGKEGFTASKIIKGGEI